MASPSCCCLCPCNVYVEWQQEQPLLCWGAVLHHRLLFLGLSVLSKAWEARFGVWVLGTCVKPSWLPRHAEIKDALSRVKYNSSTDMKPQYNETPGKLRRLLAARCPRLLLAAGLSLQHWQGGVSKGVGWGHCTLWCLTTGRLMTKMTHVRRKYGTGGVKRGHSKGTCCSCAGVCLCAACCPPLACGV